MAAPAPRWLLVLEVAALAACALVPLPVPALVPLLAVAALSVAVRGSSLFAAATEGWLFATTLGALAGLAALAAAVLVATPLLERGLGLAVVWSSAPEVRGSAAQLVVAGILAGAAALAHELVLRRWVVERCYQLGASSATAITAGAVMEALLGPGALGEPAGLGAHLGAGVLGAGLGLLYWRGGRRVGPSVAARLALTWGALILQSLRWIG